MTDAFSTPANHAFDHPELEQLQAEAGPSSSNRISEDAIPDAFEVEDTINLIIAGGYKTVCGDHLSPSFRGVTRTRPTDSVDWIAIPR